MQVISASPSSDRAGKVALARSILVAELLLAAGVALAWLCLGTPLVSTYTPTGWVSASDVVLGMLVWGFAIVVPVGFLLLGATRTVMILEEWMGGRRRPLAPHLRSALGADHLAFTGLVLPGGRRVSELVLGPFGIVVFAEVPPPSASRHVGPRWEVRDGSGRWIPIEGPVDRASRSAERVRSWLGTDDRDFVVRVYAAVVTDDPRIQRSPTCAVVSPADLTSWMAGLPFQRGLTPVRRERLASLVGAHATRG